jgi:hypothetical protein
MIPFGNNNILSKEDTDNTPMGKLLDSTKNGNKHITMHDVLNTAKTHTSHVKPSVGGMVTFNYAPESHKRLPHWDRFPLLFVTDVRGDLFKGINLLYLPPILRERIIQRIRDTTDRHKDEHTKDRLTYKILQHATKLKEFLPCVKTYHVNGVKSKFLPIHKDHWDISTKLPMAKFKPTVRTK